ncbi:Gamma-glutamylputrescine oxidoreductase [Lacunisphaera limnophila]|uniref:Gamma-glutamylputrescine oxidoreductase n=1 Tax=Lacunisphaera limnophila TaxID=1838286 RepID=A0A1D8AUJ9_9BACT|nr:FAD-binding oxidoreductase [Lacunisphaera limnophila]AOS44567.1 Gamma-glutamylputrescine oxidoreductase [Lacunisphaera limnophila]
MNTPIWDDRDWRPLPTLVGPVRADVCVVGLGASGLAAIEELVDQGVAVVGVEGQAVGAGAAGRNGGFVLAGLAKFFNETVVQCGEAAAGAIYRQTAREIARQAQDMPAIVRQSGALRIAADAAELADCAQHLAALRYCGFPAAAYTGPEGEGLLLPEDGVTQPLHRVRAVAQRLRQRETRLYENSPARKLVAGAVVTDQGTVHCDSVIVAVDGRLERILPELAGRVRTARLQMLATAPAPEVQFSRPVYYRQGYEYWQQLPDRSIALGGFRDQAGDEEWTGDDAPTERVQGLLEKFLRQHLKVRAPVTHRWAASVGYTPDGLPILEEVRPKTWAVGGYNGTGNIAGVLGARAAARLVCGQGSEWAAALAGARAHAGRR